ncbi:MAG: signal peptidase I [Clostridia bacterium]|nr:signal peptidase I [Clostridia bacterium]
MENWELEQSEIAQPEEPVVEDTPVKGKEKQSWLRTAYDLFGNIIVALIVVSVIFSFCFRQVVVDGASMNDTLANQDRLVLQTAFYTPDRGDIVVIYQENEPEKPLIKRVIALEGDSLRLDVEKNEVHLKKAGQNNWVLLDESAYVNYPLAWGVGGNRGVSEVEVPAGHIFVMGDHRNNSNDSRYLGCISVDDVVGRAFLRVYPMKDFGLI